MAAGSEGGGLPAAGIRGTAAATRAAKLMPLDEPRYRLRFVESPEQLGASNSVFVIGRKKDIPAAIPTLSGLADGTTRLVDAMVEGMEPSDSSSVVQEAYIGGRVVVILLPEACSRHNCAAQPVALRDALRGALGGASDFPAFVVLALPNAELAFASACAVARAFPMYSRKTSAASKELRGAEVRVLCHCADGSVPDLGPIANTASSIRLAAAMVDAPPCELHTDAFVDIAKRVATEVAAKSIKVIRGTELRDGGFGGLWNVGKAAEHPPALVVLEYCPKDVDPESPSICIAGKGIIMDTGGIQLKPKAGIVGMKRDCGGACAALGAFRSIALSGTCKRRVCVLLCLAENSISEKAFLPDDIIHMYSGKTVEVNNTDAEGRLVLGDGVAYAAQHLNPAVIFDIATLTGAQGIATGRHFGAIYCNNEDLETLAVAAGRSSGDLVHPVPYAPEFFQKEFRSVVADMLNSVRDRSNAQVSCAGQFIGSHMQPYLDEGNLWCHFDIAAPAYAAERGTGFGVALLVDLCDKLKLD